MLFEIFSVVLVIAVIALLLYMLSWLWEKLSGGLVKDIIESETRGELVCRVLIYVLFSVLIFTVEVYIIATVWEAIF